MENFPEWLNVISRNDFGLFYKKQVTRELRKAIFLHILQYDFSKKDPKGELYLCENTYFELNTFWSRYPIVDSVKEEIITEITREIQKLGWKIQLTFNNTALFIFSSEKLPASCWVGDL